MKIGSFLIMAATASFIAGSLGGCSGAKRAFGMEKITPDEFTIVTKAPLVLPPDYSLRPPRPGAPNPSFVEPERKAEYALFGNEGLSENPQGYTGGEMTLLDTAGASSATSDIRQVLNSETASLVEKDETIAEKILFWQQPAEEAANVIDPKKEAERLKDAKTPADAGDGQKTGSKTAQAPKEKKKSWFGGIF